MNKIVVLIMLITFYWFSASAISQTDNSDIAYIYAKKLYDDQIYDIAAEQFHEYAEKNPLSVKAADALLMAGNSYFKIQHYAKAQKEYFFLILKFPDAKGIDQAQFKIAQCFQALKNYTAAANSYKQVHIYYPKSDLAQESLYLSAKMHYSAQNYEETIETLYDFLENYSATSISQEAQLLLVSAFIKSNNYLRAKVEIDKILGATQVGRYHAQAMLMKAKLARLFGHLQDAESGYRSLIEKYAKNNMSEIIEIKDEAFFQLGDIYRQKGMFEKSTETITNISNYPTKTNCLNLIANNHFSSKNYIQAIDHFNKVIASFDSSYSLHACFMLGRSYQAISEFSKAIASFENVIKQVAFSKEDSLNIPLVRESYKNICYCYLNLNQPEIGISYLKKYKANAKPGEDFEEIDYQIAYLLETKANDVERAIRAYNDFIDYYPKSNLIDDAYYGMARCYEKNGNIDRAVNHYRTFLTKFPASQAYFDVNERMNYISTYFPSNDTVLEKLGGLIQQIILNMANLQTQIPIMRIYFHELKDYELCVSFFKQLEANSNLNEKEELLYYLARSYQLLGEKDKSNLQKTLLDSAASYYEILINNFPTSQWVDDAAYHKIEIMLSKNEQLSDLIDILNSYVIAYNESPLLENIYFKLGTLQLNSGVKSSIDSLEVYRNFENIISKFPTSPLKDAAMYYQSILLYEKNNYSSAETHLEKLTKNYPSSPYSCKAYFLLGRIADSNKDYLRAHDFFKIIIDQYYYSDYVDSAHLYISSLLLKQQKTSEALIYFNKIYDKLYYSNETYFNENFKSYKSTSEEIIYNLALCYQLLNKKEQAVQLFQEYRDKYPKGKYSEAVLFSLAELFHIQERESQLIAIDYLKQIEKDFPATPHLADCFFKIGDIYFDLKEYENSNEYYLKAIELSPLEDETLKSCALAQVIVGLYRLGHLSQADERLKSFEKQFKEKRNLIATAKLERANYLLEIKEFKEAENIFKEVRSNFKRSPEGARAEFLLGKLYLILNRHQESLEILSELIEKSWDKSILPEVYITLGNFYYLQAKQFDNAILAYKKAIENPVIDEQNLLTGMNNLIKCYADIQMWNQAIALTRRYVEKFPIHDDTFEKKIQIAYFYYRLKEYDYAIHLFKNLKPEADLENEPRIQYWIGDSYFEKGHFQQAIQEYLKIVYLSRPTKLLGQYRITAQYQSGIAYMKLGKLENARQLFQKIIIEQGADSVFGKPAKERVEEIELLISEKRRKG